MTFFIFKFFLQFCNHLPTYIKFFPTLPPPLKIWKICKYICNNWNCSLVLPVFTKYTILLSKLNVINLFYLFNIFPAFLHKHIYSGTYKITMEWEDDCRTNVMNLNSSMSTKHRCSVNWPISVNMMILKLQVKLYLITTLNTYEMD